MPLTERGKAIAANPALAPKTPVDWAFRKAVACELIFAWKDSGPAGKRALERVMFNVGIEFHDGEWAFATEHGHLHVR